VSRPYRLTRWAGDFIELGRFATFAEAAQAFWAEGGKRADCTLQLVNLDRCDEGDSGLTFEEREDLSAGRLDMTLEVA
jgi:hypothetical protein